MPLYTRKPLSQSLYTPLHLATVTGRLVSHGTGRQCSSHILRNIANTTSHIELAPDDTQLFSGTHSMTAQRRFSLHNDCKRMSSHTQRLPRQYNRSIETFQMEQMTAQRVQMSHSMVRNHESMCEMSQFKRNKSQMSFLDHGRSYSHHPP